MILTVDMGNTDIKLGVFESDNLVFTARLSSVRGKTNDQYAIEIGQILKLNNIDASLIEGSILSSVVPELTEAIKAAISKLTGSLPMIVGPGIKTGINILIDQPRQLGADLLVGAVAVAEEYPLPCYIVDLGTATKITVVGDDRSFRGGMIAPGIEVSLSALSSNASQLHSITIEAPEKCVGTNTIDCMQSGIVFGTASMIDGIIDRFNKELGISAYVVATGGYSSEIIPFCKNVDKTDPTLLLKGLKVLYNKNKQ